MAKRSGKFYRKNEAEIMQMLGLNPTKGSGNGWIEKEDGENEHCLCQLKSTDANSIKINKLDIDKLLYHSGVSKKIPIFAIQFLQSNEVFLLIKPEDIIDVSKYLRTGTYNANTSLIDIDETKYKNPKQCKSKIRSSQESRDEFRKEMENKYKKGKRSAK